VRSEHDLASLATETQPHDPPVFAPHMRGTCTGSAGEVWYELLRGGGKPGIKEKFLEGTRWQSDLFSILRTRKQRWPDVGAYLRDVGDAVAVALVEGGVWGGWRMVLLGLLKRIMSLWLGRGVLIV